MAAAEQDEAQQRPGGEVERPVGGGAQAAAQLAVVAAAGVLDAELDPRLGADARPRLAVAVDEGGAQGVVAGGDGGQRSAQGGGVELAFDPRRGDDVVGGGRRRQALQEPQRLLAVGQGQLGGTGAAGDEGRPAGGVRRRGRGRQLGEGGPLQQVGVVEGDAQHLLGEHLQLGGGERIEPQGGERDVVRHGVAAQDLRGPLGEAGGEAARLTGRSFGLSALRRRSLS